MNSSITITIKDIYGTDTPNIPDDYEAVSFDIVSDDEVYLSAYMPNPVFRSNRKPNRPIGPRIILRKKKKYQFVFREYGEIKPGEWGVNISGIVLSGQSRAFPDIREAGNCWPGVTMIFDRVEVKE